MFTPLRHGLYETKSDTSEKTYILNPREVTCTCPDFQCRRIERDKDDPERRCKHLARLAEYQQEQTTLARLSDRALTLTEEQLVALAHKHNGTPAGAACWIELAKRQVRRAELEQTRELFK